MELQRLLAAGRLILIGLLVPSCASPPPVAVAPTDTLVPVGTTTPAIGRTGNAGTGTFQLDVDSLIPPAPERTLILQNCTTCHSFVRIVRARWDKGQWESNRQRMRPNVSQLTDQQVDAIYHYLEANFSPGKPPPDLPPDILHNPNY